MNQFWTPFILRVCKEAGKFTNAVYGSRDTVAIITVKIVIADDKPLAWSIESSHKVEPSNKAKNLAPEIIEGMLQT